MTVTTAQLLRFAGLALGTVGVMRATWALRTEHAFPLGELLRRELRVSSRVPHAVLVCITAGAMLVIVPVAWLLATGRASMMVDPRATDGAAVGILATVAVKLLLVLFEELAFRAGVIRVFSARLGTIGALTVGACAFAAAHGRDAIGTAVLFVDGVGFGVAYLATGSLRASIAWHAAKNLSVWLLGGQSTIELAASPLRLAFTNGAPSGSHPAELVSAVAVVAVASLWLARYATRGGRPSRASTGPVPAERTTRAPAGAGEPPLVT